MRASVTDILGVPRAAIPCYRDCVAVYAAERVVLWCLSGGTQRCAIQRPQALRRGVEKREKATCALWNH